MQDGSRVCLTESTGKAAAMILNDRETDRGAV